jgi:hypothetical protein
MLKSAKWAIQRKHRPFKLNTGTILSDGGISRSKNSLNFWCGAQQRCNKLARRHRWEGWFRHWAATTTSLSRTRRITSVRLPFRYSVRAVWECAHHLRGETLIKPAAHQPPPNPCLSCGAPLHRPGGWLLDFSIALKLNTTATQRARVGENALQMSNGAKIWAAAPLICSERAC